MTLFCPTLLTSLASKEPLISRWHLNGSTNTAYLVNQHDGHVVDTGQTDSDEDDGNIYMDVLLYLTGKNPLVRLCPRCYGQSPCNPQQKGIWIFQTTG